MEQIFRMIQAPWKGGKLGHDQIGTYIQQRGDIMELQIPKKIYAKNYFSLICCFCFSLLLKHLVVAITRLQVWIIFAIIKEYEINYSYTIWIT